MSMSFQKKSHRWLEYRARESSDVNRPLIPLRSHELKRIVIRRDICLSTRATLRSIRSLINNRHSCRFFFNANHATINSASSDSRSAALHCVTCLFRRPGRTSERLSRPGDVSTRARNRRVVRAREEGLFHHITRRRNSTLNARIHSASES